MKARGLALIVVVGILGVLAVLAVAFVAMAQLERRASEQRVNAARAYLLARSGIEDALARLDLGQDPAYGGENWDGSPDGLLSGYEAGQEVFHRTGINTPADAEACPVRHALRPSFFVAAAGNPATLPVDARDRGYSGLLAGDHAPKGNGYALRVSSGQGFYLNGGDPAAPPEAGYNAVLRRMLGTLAEALDRDVQPDGTLAPDDTKPVDQADGLALVDARPPGGWRSWSQVRDLALGGSREKLDTLRPYLALHAWVDRKVIAPNAALSMAEGTDWLGLPGKPYHSWGEMILAHAKTSPGSRAPDFERIPMHGGRILGRAPVDLAWARTRLPALIALLGGLQGLYLDEATATPITCWQDAKDAVGSLRAAEISLDWSPGDDAHLLAAQIMDGASGVASWRQWDAFCDTCLPAPSPPPSVSPSADLPPPPAVDSNRPPTLMVLSAWWSAVIASAQGSLDEAKKVGIPSLLAPTQVNLLRAKRDILKANFNPNSRLNKFSPNASMRRSVDKQDLVAYSTEFSLLPMAGPKEISASGRVIGPGGRLLAGRTLETLAGSPGICRLTTQKEFVCEDLGDPGIAGDERAFRLPGKQPFISRSAGTWGHALPELGGQGAGLQTYPEPVVDDGRGLSHRPADYDGSVQLATLETPAEEGYGVAAATRDMKMLVRYTGHMDLDLADAGDASKPNRTDLNQVSRSELGLGLLDAAKPNTLHPDGCYAERDCAPSYLDKGNANGFHGLMSFWIKANHAPPFGGVLGIGTSRGHPFVRWSNLTKAQRDTLDQFFFLGDVFYTFHGTGCYCQMEIGHQSNDLEEEHQYRTAGGLAEHRWQLVTLSWDFQGLNNHADVCQLLIDHGLPRTGTRSSADLYPSQQGGNNPFWADDITADHKPDGQNLVPHQLGLGRGNARGDTAESAAYSFIGSGADATFDEFAVWDFGGASLAAAAGGQGISTPASLETLAAPSVLASNRFREGRYGKEAAEYFSPPIRLDGPCRLLGLAWTQVVPRGLRAPLPPGGQAGVDGDEGPDGAVSFALVDDQGLAIAAGLVDDAFSPVDRRIGRPFRLHAIFQPNLADSVNTPILDPLALDDVTVLYEPAGGPALLAWEDGDAD